MAKKKGGFHVVRIAHNDKFFSYEIWFENQPYLLPSISLIGYGSAVLGKREAYTIVRALNSGVWWPNLKRR